MDGGWCSTIEIMQFTGLKDHEGNDIYEGDLLQQYERPNYPYWEVVYKNDGFWIVSGDTKQRLTSVMGFPKGLKIKGNIYKNPDLSTFPKEKQHNNNFKKDSSKKSGVTIMDVQKVDDDYVRKAVLGNPSKK